METAETLYEHVYYLVKETKKPKYLDFYDLRETDNPEYYLDQTVRINGKWFFMTTGKTHFRSAADRDNAPKIYIKYLYKKKQIYILQKRSVS